MLLLLFAVVVVVVVAVVVVAVVVAVVVVVNFTLKMSENVVKRNEFCVSQRIALYRRYQFIVIISIIIIIIINCRFHEKKRQIPSQCPLHEMKTVSLTACSRPGRWCL